MLSHVQEKLESEISKSKAPTDMTSKTIIQIYGSIETWALINAKTG